MSEPSKRVAALLEPETFEAYQRTLQYLAQRLEAARHAEAALEEARFLVVAVDAERVRQWRVICETHELDPDAEYTMDAAGRVYGKSSTESSERETHPVDRG